MCASGGMPIRNGQPGPFSPSPKAPQPAPTPVELVPALRALRSAYLDQFDHRTERGRFHIQKATFLLKCLGYPPASGLEFDQYFRGPYSSALSALYYDSRWAQAVRRRTATELPVETLLAVRDAMKMGDAFLEALTTVLDVASQYYEPGRKIPHHSHTEILRRAMTRARSMKSDISSCIWAKVMRFFDVHPTLAGNLATKPRRSNATFK